MKSQRLVLLGLAAIVPMLAVSCATNGSAQKKYADATPIEWSLRLADAQMARETKPPKLDYTMGLFTLSLLKLDEVKQDNRYLAFTQEKVGSLISPDGSVKGYRPQEYQLDSLNPMKTVLALWKITGEERYKLASQKMVKQLETQPRTPDGGYWHKEKYTNQMWLDGIYMADPFHAECGKLFGDPHAFDEVAKQIRLIDQHTYDAASGLNYHGWDAAKVQTWANPVTGCSSNFWGRASGWYAMALVDVLDFMPANHPARAEIIATLDKTAKGIVKWQDAKSGVWWQVMDQAGREGNYQEATASAMFVYSLAKGVNRGYLSRDYIPAIEKGYAGIIANFLRLDAENRWKLIQCCSVSGLCFKNSAGIPRDGTFFYYISEPIVDNDLKGVGPFILAGIEMEKLAGK